MPFRWASVLWWGFLHNNLDRAVLLRVLRQPPVVVLVLQCLGLIVFKVCQLSALVPVLGVWIVITLADPIMHAFGIITCICMDACIQCYPNMRRFLATAATITTCMAILDQSRILDEHPNDMVDLAALPMASWYACGGGGDMHEHMPQLYGDMAQRINFSLFATLIAVLSKVLFRPRLVCFVDFNFEQRQMDSLMRADQHEKKARALANAHGGLALVTESGRLRGSSAGNDGGAASSAV